MCACFKLTCGYKSSHFVPVFMELVGEKSRHCLHENMHLISTPVQVIWGKQDQVGLHHNHEHHKQDLSNALEMIREDLMCVVVWETSLIQSRVH